MALRDIPNSFDPDSESDLLFAVARFFQELGFELGELTFEDRFTIRVGHNTLIVERPGPTARSDVSGRSDLLLVRDGKALAIVETKAPNHPLTDDDALQALSYARLLLEMAPFAIVTNGQDTRVYDTFATQLSPLAIETPIGSRWQTNGQQTPTVSDDLRFEAAKILIGVNPQTLQSFCRTQAMHGIEDLKGSIAEAKKYVPELYFTRSNSIEEFKAWQATDIPCFAVVGESGIGKTNFMCATAEHAQEDHFVLFYTASNLRNGLVEAICNDFVWEFHRDRSAAYIMDRFDAIARRVSKRFILFVDGIDEYPGNRGTFKAELLDLVYRLRGRSIRLCLSCKSFDWPDFILDHRQIYNTLAQAIYPAHDSILHPNTPQDAKPREVGFWLERFTEEELNQVFPKYQAAFTLQGELHGEMRSECQMPLMLRFVADTYRNTGKDLPASISSQEIFDLYWDRRLGEIDQRIAAEQILTKLATVSVETAKRQVLLSDVRDRLTWTDAVDEAFRDIVRLGLVVVSRDQHGFEWLSFEFEKMRSYVYTIRAEQWPIRAPEEIADRICHAFGNLLMIEAVEFYLITIDRGETEVLTKLALANLDCFVALMSELDLKSSVTEQMSQDNQRRALRNRLSQYAISYSDISRKYFPEFSEKIEPYRSGAVGVWVSQSVYQFRTRTQAYPRPVLIVPPKIGSMLFNQTMSETLYADILPGGMIYLGLHDIAEKIPQKTAWDRIEAQLAGLFVQRFLDESSSPGILNERIWDMLVYRPTFSVVNTRPSQRYWQLLHYSNMSEIVSSPIRELKGRVVDLMNDFSNRIPPHGGSGEIDTTARGYVLDSQQLSRLFYWLDLLEPHQSLLTSPLPGLDDLFQYMHSHTLAPMVDVVRALLPQIISAYRSLLARNFSQIMDMFPLARLLDSPLVIEISHQAHRGDFLTLVYMLLPSMVGKLQNPHVYFSSGEDLIARGEFVRDTPKGTVETTGGSFGRGRITIVTDTLDVHEPNGILCSTRFPSHTPISDQAYQILAKETEYVLRGRQLGWINTDYGSTNHDRLDQFILQKYRSSAR